MNFIELCLAHKVIPEEHAQLRRFLALLRYETVMLSSAFSLPRKRRVGK